jgi:hypothetical protein
MFAGFVLGFLTWLSMLIGFQKLPYPVQQFLKSNRLFTDIVVFLIVYAALATISKSIVAVFGASVAGLLIDFSFMSAEYMDENPDVKERLELRYGGFMGQAERKFREIVMGT